MGSALATSHIAKEFLANLPDEVKEAIKKHQEAQRELENAQAQANAGLPISQDQLDALRERMSQTQQQALSAMGNSPAQMKASAWDSAQAAQNELNNAKRAANAFGLGWGNETGQGVYMENLDGIVELSQHIRTTKDCRDYWTRWDGWRKWQKVSKKRFASGQHYFTHYERGELDLERLADQEYLYLASDVEEIRLSFFARAIDGDVLLKHYEGEDETGQRSLCLCV